MDLASLHAAIVDSSDAAIVSKNLHGIVLSWNRAAERIFGWKAEEIIGKSIRTIIPDDRQFEEDAILEKIVAGDAVPRFETERLHKDGSTVSVAVMISPVRDSQGTIIGASKIARDISSELTAQREREENAALMRLMGDMLPVLVWVERGNGRLLWVNRGLREFFGLTSDRPTHFRWQERIEGGHEVAVGEGDEPWEAVLPIKSASASTRWLLMRTVPLIDAHGRTYLRFGTATDITDQHEAEQQIRTLLREVNHRTRNMLAVIQSLARRTVAGGGDFVERFEARIAGLATTQDLLVSHDWTGVPIEDLARQQIAATGQDPDRIAMSGPVLELAPPAAEAIGMALAELAINAHRFGALSVPEGRVTLDWSLCEPEIGKREFSICWRESDGPAVSPPEISGFGSQIIEGVPRGKLLGTVELAYPPQGLSWHLTCPARIALARPES